MQGWPLPSCEISGGNFNSQGKGGQIKEIEMALRDQLLAASRARQIELDYFVYTASWVNLLAAITATVNVPLTADSDFVWDAFNLCAYSAVGVLVVNPDYLLQVFDTGSGRNLQDNPVHVNNVSGNGQLPYILPEPKLFKGNATIQVTLQNLTAVAARVDVALIGRKVFYVAGFSRETIF